MKHGVFEEVPRSKVPPGAKILSTTWAMKQKANGVKRARMNARGFEQVDGEHYDADSISSPVVNALTIQVVMALIVIGDLYAALFDVAGAFLTSKLEANKQLYVEIPQGFEKFYGKDSVLRMIKALYGCKQSSKMFWQKLVSVLMSMGFKRSKADPCCYYKWEGNALVLILSYIDDIIAIGPKDNVLKVKAEFFKHFQCDDLGELNEYIGVKVNRNSQCMILTQPVLLQSFTDEFDVPGAAQDTPAVPGSVLTPSDAKLDPASQKRYRSGVGKLLYLMRWSRPEIYNAVRELSRFMTEASLNHLKAMYRVMDYCVHTSKRGKIIKPNRYCKWQDLKNFEFVISGTSDSDYAKDPIRRHSVSGFATFLEGANVSECSRMQKSTVLSVTEAELVSATECVQDMMYIRRLLQSIGLMVKHPMIIEIDNRGAIDLSNSWATSGRTRHIDVRYYWIRELKEQSIVYPRFIPTDSNASDLYTKNLPKESFEKHAKMFVTDMKDEDFPDDEVKKKDKGKEKSS